LAKPHGPYCARVVTQRGFGHVEPPSKSNKARLYDFREEGDPVAFPYVGNSRDRPAVLIIARKVQQEIMDSVNTEARQQFGALVSDAG
jgi:hypothetical protein